MSLPASAVGAERSDVLEVLRASGCLLVPEQLRASEKGDGDLKEGTGHSSGPGVRKLDAADRRHEVDSIGWEAELHDPVDLDKVGYSDAVRIERCTESGECSPHAPGIGLGRFDPEVQISRDPWHPMRGQRMGPDHEESDAGVRERREQVAEVLDHTLPAWSAKVVRTTGMVARV